MDDNLWENFISDIEDIYNIVKNNVNGDVADYIPQLAKVNPDLFGISICTVDGKVYNIGDVDEYFCIQSCCKPLSYGLALKEHGINKVSNHINKEPSGNRFNAFVFDDDKKPFNPLINSGAIMSTSLIQQHLSDADRFDYIINIWRSIIGKDNVGFDNSVYLSEKQHANRNYALAHIMMENGVFPENTDIEKTLSLYFQSCSITMNAQSLAKFAAMFANGGKTVDTNKQIFMPNIVRDILCVMYSSGMYDYSGRWAFDIGLPAKSGVSGIIFGIIPNVCGITVYSPRLDKIGNSLRGIEFFNMLVQKYRFHIFDTHLSGLEQKKSVNKNTELAHKTNKIYKCCKQNDSQLLFKLLSSNGLDINEGDYDGRRPLHIATDECNYECINLLLDYGANPYITDRWGLSPYQKSILTKNNTSLMLFLNKRLQLNTLKSSFDKWNDNIEV
jgi:glutaminase